MVSSNAGPHRTGVRANPAQARHEALPWPTRPSPSTEKPATSSLSTRSFEAGLVPTGTEIKSVRAGKVNIANAYARIEKGEAWLIGADIAPFEQGNRYNHDPKRNRKLLLHRRDR